MREFRWLDPWIDRISNQLANASLVTAIVGIGVYTFVAILPVAFAAWLLSGMFLHIPYFLLAVAALLFSLGPRDLLTEVNDYCSAVRDGREDDVQRILNAIESHRLAPSFRTHRRHVAHVKEIVAAKESTTRPRH